MDTTNHTLSTEYAILGATLSKPQIIPELGLSQDDFSSIETKAVWVTLSEMYRQGDPIDLASVAIRMNGKVPGHVLAQWASCATIPSMAKVHARELSFKRTLSQMVAELSLVSQASQLDQFRHKWTQAGTACSPTWSSLVTEYIEVASGEFLVGEIYTALAAQSANDKAAIRKAIQRLVDDKVIAPTGKRAGQYKRIDKNINKMDILAAPIERFPIHLPFGISGTDDSLVEINPKEIVLVCGNSNAGKTTFLINTILYSLTLMSLNAFKSNNHAIRYFSTEMGPSAMAKKLLLFGRHCLEMWSAGVETVERQADFQDVLVPDGINVVDYLEAPGGDFTMLAPALTDIHAKLGKGIALVAVQLAPGSMLPRGGSGMWEKPRLVVNLTNSREQKFSTIEIMKAKHPLNGNCNGKQLDYTIPDGSRMRAVSYWDWPDKLREQRKMANYHLRDAVIETFPLTKKAESVKIQHIDYEIDQFPN